jgi:hypothetical protein
MFVSLDDILVVLVLLSIKHFIVDFCLQTSSMVEQKGIYGAKMGIVHSFQHALGTCMVFYFFLEPLAVLMFGLLDMLIHYHIDWVKININRSKHLTPNDKEFWMWLGADQLAHSLTYIWFIWILV